MLGSRLARRIVLPLLLLHAALFGLLAWASVAIANRSVTEELGAAADRVASTLDALGVPPEHREKILPPLARVVGCELLVGEYATRKGWERDDYVLYERASIKGPDRYTVLFDKKRVARRRLDALWPILGTGAVGLLVALVLGMAVARAIAGPVKRLASQAAAFASGTFEESRGERGPGEVGELQDAFHSMGCAIKEGEAALRESERLATLGRLAGGIAHELRNPLTAIRIAVETATGGDEKGRIEARQIALGEIDRLDRTLRELLDFARPRKPSLAEFALADLFADVVALLKPQCDHLRVVLTSSLEAAPRLTADYDRVKQALLNLVLNAAQAQPEGGSVHLRAAAGLIEVADEGAGIRPEVQGSILEPFVTTRAAGIGLGLAVVKQVADEHGARLDFRTGPTGTTFSLTFPPAPPSPAP